MKTTEELAAKSEDYRAGYRDALEEMSEGFRSGFYQHHREMIRRVASVLTGDPPKKKTTKKTTKKKAAAK